jgi:glutamate-1-semialdehyde 2,1-aminomutase
MGLLEEPGNKTQELYRHAKTIIPAGTQLLSKRPEMIAPDQWPAYFREARGCEVWDMDGRHYWDMSILGIGACLLGFRDPDVTKAVTRRINLGSMSSLNPPEEVELADRLCTIHPWAEQVRYGRTGGEMASVAVRIARATTDRSAIAVCGYHGWSDWYIAANLGDHDAIRGHLLPGLDPLGVPRELRDTAYPFAYNSKEEFAAIIKEQGHRLAAVVMEPCRHADPEPGFLEYVRDEAHKAGALLIFDEITIGWRRIHGAAHLLYDVAPDMALFAKTLGNGHPIAAVIGTKAAMEGAHESFISSAYWTESVGPAAALATLKKMEESNVVSHVNRLGTRIQDLWRTKAEANGLPLEVMGFPCAPSFKFNHELAQELKTLYTQLMLEKGFLAMALIYVSLAHTDEVVDKFAVALDETFGEMGDLLRKGTVAESLKGPVAHAGFKRLI